MHLWLGGYLERIYQSIKDIVSTFFQDIRLISLSHKRQKHQGNNTCQNATQAKWDPDWTESVIEWDRFVVSGGFRDSVIGGQACLHWHQTLLLMTQTTPPPVLFPIYSFSFPMHWEMENWVYTDVSVNWVRQARHSVLGNAAKGFMNQTESEQRFCNSQVHVKWWPKATKRRL